MRQCTQRTQQSWPSMKYSVMEIIFTTEKFLSSTYIFYEQYSQEINGNLALFPDGLYVEQINEKKVGSHY